MRLNQGEPLISLNARWPADGPRQLPENFPLDSPKTVNLSSLFAPLRHPVRESITAAPDPQMVRENVSPAVNGLRAG